MIFKTVGGMEFYADEEDRDFILSKKWYHFKSHSGYYIHTYLGEIRDKKKIWLHRFIMNINDKKLVVDHINRNTVDNRRKNLRICTLKNNNHNSGPNRTNITGYKGVQLRKDNGKYRAVIRINGKHISLGQFDTAIDAAKCFNDAAKKYHGEYAYLNKVEEV
jgi:hypothetical protein